MDITAQQCLYITTCIVIYEAPISKHCKYGTPSWRVAPEFEPHTLKLMEMYLEFPAF